MGADALFEAGEIGEAEDLATAHEVDDLSGRHHERSQEDESAAGSVGLSVLLGGRADDSTTERMPEHHNVLATLIDGSRDGKLAVVSRDLTRALPVPQIARRLQDVLDDWVGLAPKPYPVEAGSWKNWVKITAAPNIEKPVSMVTMSVSATERCISVSKSRPSSW